MNKLVKKLIGVEPKTTFISKAQNGLRFSFSYNTGKKDNKGKIIYKTREFNSRQEAEAFRKKSGKVGKITDKGNLGTTVLKADNSNSKSTAYRRQQEESQYNSLTFKQAYNKARSLGKEAFGYKGKVYSTDLTNPSDRNMTALKKMYGNYLGYLNDPKLQNKVSRAGRERLNKGMNVEKAPKVTNDNTKKNNMSKVALNFNAAGLVDALMPTNAISNFIKMGADKLMGEHYTPETYASGFNPFGYVKDFNEGNYGNLGLRGLDAYLTLGAPGARVNITPRGTNVTSGADVLSDGSRVFSKWHLNSLGPTATQSNGILRNAKGTTYFIDNGLFMRDLSVPALIAAPLVLPASKKYGGSLNRVPFYLKGTLKEGLQAASELIPIYGTYKAGQRFFKNPSWGKAGEFALSALGDAAMLTGVGTGVGLALKAGNMAAKTGKVAKTASTLQKINAARGLKYGRASESYYDSALKVALNLANAPSSKGLEKAIARGNDLVKKSIWADGAANNYSNAKWAIETGLGSGIGSKTGKLFNKN